MPKEKTIKQRKNRLGLLLSIIINVLIVAYIAIHEFGKSGQNAPNIAQLDINLRYLLLGAACFGAALLMETLKYKSMMIAAEGKYDSVGAFECAVLGKYYDNITPLGAGGQPFQMYYLKKRGLSTGSAAALPVAGYLGLHLAFVTIAIVVFLFNSSVTEHVAAIRYTAYVGLLFYLFIPTCIILFAIIPNTFSKMVCAVARLLSKVHIVKDYDAAVKKIFGTLGEYTDTLKTMGAHPHLLFKVLFFSFLYQVAILSIPYFVLRAFGGESSWWTVFSMLVFVNAAITIIPTPGNAGAAEGSFYAVFSTLTSAYLFWAMIIWRLLCYYSWLALGLVLTTKSAATKRAKPAHKMSEGPLRVAEFLDIYYPHIDGVISTVDAYAQRLNSNGGYCCVVVPRAAGHYEDNKPFDVVRTAAVKFPGIEYLLPTPMFSRGLRSFIANGNFDVFHVHSPFFEGEFAVRMGRKLGIPVVATFHSKFYDDILSITHSRFLARMVTNHVVKFFSKVDEVWACSESTAETLRSYGFRGEIGVMENGVNIPPDTLDHELLRARAVEEYRLPQNKRMLLFVGQQIWQKNLKLILETTKRLKEQGGGYFTVIAGEGCNAEAIKRYAASLELDGEDVLFTGQIADRELLNGLFLASDLFFFPSAYDNAPLVLREAALMGRPALLLAGSNSAECVKDGENGFTEINDTEKMAAKISFAFEHTDLEKIGQRAKETIPINWDEILARVNEKYRRLEKRSYSRVDIRSAASEAES